MIRHKWEDVSFSKYNKQEHCIKCGVYRDWCGGDYQCWQYWYPVKSVYEAIRKIYKRPECKSLDK